MVIEPPQHADDRPVRSNASIRNVGHPAVKSLESVADWRRPVEGKHRKYESSLQSILRCELAPALSCFVL